MGLRCILKVPGASEEKITPLEGFLQLTVKSVGESDYGNDNIDDEEDGDDDDDGDDGDVDDDVDGDDEDGDDDDDDEDGDDDDDARTSKDHISRAPHPI